MNKYILIFLFSAAYYSAQSTKIFTKLSFPDNACAKPINIEVLLYQDTDSLRFLSNKCSDTLIIGRKLQNKYFVDIRNGDYASYKNEINFSEGKNVVFERSIHGKETLINEIQITKTTNPLFGSKGNKSTFSVSNNDALNNGTSLDTVLKLPGVFSGIGNGITLNGKSTSIYVDGLPALLSGQDLLNYLSSIPAASIQKIELINNPGATYDADSASSIINIITNKKSKEGIGGMLISNTNFFIKQKYQSALVLNGLFRRVSWNFNLNYSQLGFENNNEIRVINKFNDDLFQNKVYNDGLNEPFVIESSLSYPLSDKTTASFRYRVLNSREKNNAKTFLSLLTDKNNIELGGEGSQLTTNQKNDVLLKINHKLGKSADVISLTYNGLFFDKNLQTTSINSSINQNTDNNSYNNDFSLNSNKLMVDSEFGTRYFKLNAGAKGSASEIHSNGIYLTNFTNYKILNFLYNEYSGAIYFELNKEIKKFNVTGGLRYESINFKSFINNNELNRCQINKLFPSVNLGYTISSMIDLNLSYAKKIKSPGYQDLDPNNSGISNDYFMDQGNPYLVPSIIDNYEFRTNFLKMGFFSLTHTSTDVDNFAIAKYEDGKYIQAIEPFYNITNWGASFGMPFPLGIITKGFSYASSIADINKINYLYLYSGINFPKYKLNSFHVANEGLYYFGVNSNIILPFSTKLNVNYQYVSSGNHMIYTLDKPYYKFDLTITKSLLDNNLRMSFSALDIFKTASGINGSFKNNNIDLYLKTYSDTQRFMLSLTYLFGNNKINKPNINYQSDNRENTKSTLDFKP